MKKTQTKNTTGKIILSLVLLFLGEGFFGFGLYWPVLLSLSLVSRRAYWYGFIFGLLVSSVTHTMLGLASLLIVTAMFVFGRLRRDMRSNFWLVGLAAVMFNLISDKLMGLSWSFGEGLSVLLLTILLFRLDFFGDDLHLSSR